MAVTLDTLKEQLANRISKLITNLKSYVDKIRAYIEENYATKVEVTEQVAGLEAEIEEGLETLANQIANANLDS